MRPVVFPPICTCDRAIFSSHLQGSLVLDARAGDSVVVCVSLIVLFMCRLLCRFVMDYLFVRLLPFLSSVRGVCFAEVVSSNVKKYNKKIRVRIFIA